jgi:hypothetical protein
MMSERCCIDCGDPLPGVPWDTCHTEVEQIRCGKCATVAVAAMLEPSVPDHILERNNPYDLNDVARKRRPR